LQADLFFKLLTEYTSSEMLHCLRTLRTWKESSGDDIDLAAARWLEKRDDPSQAANWARDLDEARGTVGGFCQKVAMLGENESLMPHLRQKLQEFAGNELLHKVVRPLDRVLAEKLDRLEQHDAFYGRVVSLQAGVYGVTGRPARLTVTRGKAPDEADS
jgi:hypothetical protein